MKKRIITKKAITGTHNINGKIVSTQTRINELLLILEIDKQIHGFKQALQTANRLQRNKHGLL
jgi:hypothetical protein